MNLGSGKTQPEGTVDFAVSSKKSAEKGFDTFSVRFFVWVKSKATGNVIRGRFIARLRFLVGEKGWRAKCLEMCQTLQNRGF